MAGIDAPDSCRWDEEEPASVDEWPRLVRVLGAVTLILRYESH